MSEWKYHKTNSKGVVKLRRDTNESLEDVCAVLKEKNIDFEVKPEASLLIIYLTFRVYHYYWTTGRWAQKRKCLPRKHYHSKGIKDFIDRFLFNHIEDSKDDILKLIDALKKEFC